MERRPAVKPTTLRRSLTRPCPRGRSLRSWRRPPLRRPGEVFPSNRTHRAAWWGQLVHRLLQRLGFVPPEDMLVARETVLRMLRPEEVAAVSAERTVAELADEVLEAYGALSSRPDIRAIYLSGDRFHEVPFTMWLDGVVLRGNDRLCHS